MSEAAETDSPDDGPYARDDEARPKGASECQYRPRGRSPAKRRAASIRGNGDQEQRGGERLGGMGLCVDSMENEKWMKGR